MDDPLKILEQIRPCLQQWNVDARKVEVASHSENIVYSVVAENNQRYALRVHRPGYHSFEELVSEQVWTDALGQHGINVPIACRTSDGDYFASVSIEGSIRYVGLVGWLEGRTLSSLTLEPDDLCRKLTELGRLCARMHNQASDWQVPADFERHHLNVDGFMGESPFWGRFWDVPVLSPRQRALVLVAREKITRRLSTYGENPRTYSMIHADLHHENLMLDGENLTVIDFDDAGFGWHQYDIAVALLDYQGRDDFERLQRAMIQGYRQERFISDEDLALLPVFLLVRTLALIGWAQARPELGRPEYLAGRINSACRDIVALGWGEESDRK